MIPDFEALYQALINAGMTESEIEQRVKKKTESFGDFMSPEAIPVINGTLTYDFRYTESYIDDPFNFGFVGQKQILSGIYAMLK